MVKKWRIHSWGVYAEIYRGGRYIITPEGRGSESLRCYQDKQPLFRAVFYLLSLLLNCISYSSLYTPHSILINSSCVPTSTISP